jgi:hypothetical protein
MKNFLLLITLTIYLLSCSKEKSNECATVVDKKTLFRHSQALVIERGGAQYTIEVGLLTYSHYNIGDKYCY